MFRGFTLIEVLISLAIFAVITGFALANFRLGGQGEELRLAAENLASAVRRAQTQAIAGQTVFACDATRTLCDPADAAACPAGVCSAIVPRGFGVRVAIGEGRDRSIIQFADIDGDKDLDAGEVTSRESVSLTPQVAVSALSVSFDGALDIVFVPPRPRTHFSADRFPDTVAAITLRQSATGATRTVTVNRISGQISVE
jgi:prepilin-type N-terminal cleavage/methylation domain-containing protein